MTLNGHPKRGSKVKYRLDIYLPDTTGKDLLHRMESDSPFMTIGVNDLIDPRSFPDEVTETLKRETKKPWPPGVLLKVVRLMHTFNPSNDSGPESKRPAWHVIGIFTESVPNSAGSILPKSPSAKPNDKGKK